MLFKLIVKFVLVASILQDSVCPLELNGHNVTAKDNNNNKDSSETSVVVGSSSRREETSADDGFIEMLKDVAPKIVNDELFSLLETEMPKDKNVTALWINVADAIIETTRRIIRPLLPRLFEFTYDAELSPECTRSLTNLVFDLMDGKTYAAKVLDSWGKLKTGFMEGSLSMIGHYEECLSINVPHETTRLSSDANSEDSSYFRGQYCMVHVTVAMPPKPKNLTIFTRILNFTNTRLEGKFPEEISKFLGSLYDRPGRLGLCVPSTCSKGEIQRFVDAVLQNSDFLHLKVKHCEMHEQPTWKGYQIAIIIIFCTLAAFIIMGTMVDVTDEFIAQKFGKDSLKTIRDFFCCFSVRINAKEVLKTNSPPGDISALHGIRVLSMSWLVYSHTYLLPIREMFSNARTYIYAVQGLLFQGIMNGFLIVDTFFFMSSLLFTYTTLRKLEKSKGQFNIPQSVFNRIYRLFFPMAFSVIFVFIWLNLSDGPMWKEVIGWQVERCERTWWATILFFNNFIPNKDICLEHTWYLGADMQLFIFFIPVLLTLYRWHKTGIVLTFVLVFLGALSSAITVLATGLPALPLYSYGNEKDIFEVIHVVHLWPNFHIVTYGLGTLTGFLLYKKRSISIPKVIRLIGWIIALVSGLTVIWFSYFWNNNHLKYPAMFAFFAAFQRVAWSFTLAWIIYLCATGNGGWINKVLSWKVFLPLSRLTFVVYIIHQLIIWTRDGIKQQGLFFSHYTMFCEFTVNVTFAFVLAFFFHLMIEAPFSVMHRKYLTRLFEGAEITINRKEDEVVKEDISTKL